MSVAPQCALTSHYLTPCPGREHRPILLGMVVAQEWSGVFVGIAPGFYADGNTLYLQVNTVQACNRWPGVNHVAPRELKNSRMFQRRLNRIHRQCPRPRARARVRTEASCWSVSRIALGPASGRLGLARPWSGAGPDTAKLSRPRVSVTVSCEGPPRTPWRRRHLRRKKIGSRPAERGEPHSP